MCAKVQAEELALLMIRIAPLQKVLIDERYIPTPAINFPQTLENPRLLLVGTNFGKSKIVFGWFYLVLDFPQGIFVLVD